MIHVMKNYIPTFAFDTDFMYFPADSKDDPSYTVESRLLEMLNYDIGYQLKVLFSFYDWFLNFICFHFHV